MDVNNAKSQMRKGMLEYCILLLLKRVPAYASDIMLSTRILLAFVVTAVIGTGLAGKIKVFDDARRELRDKRCRDEKTRDGKGLGWNRISITGIEIV